MLAKLYHPFITELKAVEDRQVITLILQINRHVQLGKCPLILTLGILKPRVLLPEFLVRRDLGREVRRVLERLG